MIQTLIIRSSLAALLASSALACKGDDKPGAKAPTSDQAATDQTPAEPESTLLAVGAQAPDFTSEAHDGTVVTLSALRGEPAVLFFYPKDETSGCIIETESFRDNIAEFNQLAVDVIGVSVDTLESHRQFAENHGLNFPLLADPKGELAAKYGVPSKNGYFARVTYVIGPDGTIAHVYPKVNPTGHAAEVLAAVKALMNR